MSAASLSGKPQLFDVRNTRSGNNRTANKKLYHVLRALFARSRTDGFPIHNPFESADEVRQYLNGERIICLRCGKPYKALQAHLRVHGWDAEEYKRFYGLPWRTGLTCAGTKERKSLNGKRICADGAGLASIAPDDVTKNRAKAHATRQRHSFVRSAIAKERIRKVNGGVEWTDADYYRVLETMASSDLVAREVAGTPGFPSLTAFYRQKRLSEQLEAAYNQTIKGLSVAAQARGHHLDSDELSKEVCRRRSNGELVKSVAQALGISVITVIEHSHGFKRQLKQVCARGHQLNDKRQCRTCNTEHARLRRGHLSRTESSMTMVDGTCMACDTPIKKKRISGSKPKLCEHCRVLRQRAANRVSYRRKMDRVAAIKEAEGE